MILHAWLLHQRLVLEGSQALDAAVEFAVQKVGRFFAQAKREPCTFWLRARQEALCPS